jgi:hypothetical protein
MSDEIFRFDAKERQDLTDSVQRWINEIDDMEEYPEEDYDQLVRLKALLSKLCGG